MHYLKLNGFDWILFQLNCHEDEMSMTYAELSLLIQSCGYLKKLVIKCDIWCTSVFDDSMFRLFAQHNKHLKSLSLFPGNLETTDKGLESLTRMPALERVEFNGFSAFTELGFNKFIENSHSLQHCFLCDCFAITQTFIDCLILIFKSKNPFPFIL